MSKQNEILDMMAALLEVPREQLNQDSNPETIASWDSFKHTVMLMAVEEKFGFRLSDDEMISVTNAAELIELVDRKVNG